jgi:alkaline phosphatase D
MTVRIIQITDTHFSPSKTHFNSNWQPLADWIRQENPDLVVHTGDLALDGAGTEDDLAFSVSLLNELSIPVLSVPGNHDIGHMLDGAQPVNAERLERWRRVVGPEEWIHEIGNWRLIGFNSLILGDNSDGEEAQFAWLEDALSSAEGRRIAIFAHKPLFVDEPGEGDTGYWSVRPAARQRMCDLLAEHDVALYASGHLHRAWTGHLNRTKLVWGPAASFIVGPMERDMPGERLVGAVIHTLDDDVTSEIVEIAGMAPFLLDDVIDEVYPRAKPVVEETAA